MLFFVATRDRGAAHWVKRGTIVARTNVHAERTLRKEYKIPRTTQVLALSAGYPANMTFGKGKPLSARQERADKVTAPPSPLPRSKVGFILQSPIRRTY